MWLILTWLVSAVSLLLAAHILRGFEVSSFPAALVAALAIGLINATLGMILKIVTFPLTIITFGIFWIVINALMLKLAAILVPGFEINGFSPAFFGAIVVSLVNLLFRVVAGSIRADARHQG